MISTQYFKLAESLGGVKPFMPSCTDDPQIHPAGKRRAAGVADSLIRLSVGLEEAEDLVADLEQAFEKISSREKEIVRSNSL